MKATEPTGASLRSSTRPSMYFTRLVLLGSTVPVEPTQTWACAGGTLKTKTAIAARPRNNFRKHEAGIAYTSPYWNVLPYGEPAMEQMMDQYARAVPSMG